MNFKYKFGKTPIQCKFPVVDKTKGPSAIFVVILGFKQYIA